MKLNDISKKNLHLTFLFVFVYVFMEWLFFATKPSFMWVMTFWKKMEILFLTFLIFSVPVSFVFILIWITSRFFNHDLSSQIFRWSGILFLSSILTLLSTILIDNFTYTVFSFGIVSSRGIWRLGYVFLFIVFYLLMTRKVANSDFFADIQNPILYRSVVFLILSSSILFFLQIPKTQKSSSVNSTNSPSERPNIILLGIDGVNAENMSAYGYYRDTTPNIKAHVPEALLAENAFSNSGNTGGSLTSLLTGKLPTTTGVVYPPDILTGEDAYEHLPGILKQHGYQTVQITMPSYGDAYDRNIRAGFDVANFRSENKQIFLPLVQKIGAENSFYFSNIIVQRIRERVLHIFFIKKMENPYEMVTTPVPPISEDERFDAIIDALNNAQSPIFIHTHMLGAHGPSFEPRKQVFSKGKTQSQSWMIDFYDDAILDFDNYFGQLFEYLSDTGKKENTVVFLYSDHGMKWQSQNRVPLIMWFPNQEVTGKFQGNAQLLDIAPTILEYIEISPPNWLEGESLLGKNLSSDRNIISANVASDIVKPEGEAGWLIQENKVSPPFYQLGTIQLVHCNSWYSLNLRKPQLTYGGITGSTSQCDGADSITPEQAKSVLLEHLKNNGYKISDYPENVPLNLVGENQ